VRSIFAGLRPLAAPQDGSTTTKEISRSHKLITSTSGLITIIGGKWTTYRKMAEDTVDLAIELNKLQPVKCKTMDLPIHGNKITADFTDHLYVYGTDTEKVLDLLKEHPEWAKKLHPRLDYIQAEVIWAVRYEMARTVEDVLSRRLRALFLDARAAIEIAPAVAKLMAAELRYNDDWELLQVNNFNYLAEGYLLIGS
jgi:glycerol-3-phosphate dehydrogenase